MAQEAGLGRDRAGDGFSVTASPNLPAWLREHGVSLAFTTYQGGKLFFLGVNPRGELSVFERTLERAMGLAGDRERFFLASQYQIWRFENVLDEGASLDGYDRLYVPQVGYTTGDLDVHDVGIDESGTPIFVGARFNCLAAVSERYHFRPLWFPPFITDLAAEDRCHLNGLAMEGGRPRYVTACAATDTESGWRAFRNHGGCVIDVEERRVVAEGLSMPHSPRLHEGRLWVLDSGRGHLGTVDRRSGAFERVAFCPGYARGLAFAGRHAILGLSQPRHEPTFSGLELERNLEGHGERPRCGLRVIDLSTGEPVAELAFGEPVRELYDIAVLEGVARPKAIGFKSDEIRTRVWADPEEAAPRSGEQGPAARNTGRDVGEAGEAHGLPRSVHG